MEIKLLGMNVDDAMIALDKYLDDACMAHLEKVRIVHGKGTGVLRNAVRQKLHRDRRVKKSYQAEYGDGDAGDCSGGTIRRGQHVSIQLSD